MCITLSLKIFLFLTLAWTSVLKHETTASAFSLNYDKERKRERDRYCRVLYERKRKEKKRKVKKRISSKHLKYLDVYKDGIFSAVTAKHRI